MSTIHHKIAFVKSQEYNGAVLAEELVLRLSELIHAGMSTIRLERYARELLQAAGAEAALPGLMGYRHTITVSINEEVAFGVPGPRILRRGDVVKIGLGLKKDGKFEYAATTVVVGIPQDKEIEALIRCAREALHAGIAAAVAGERTGSISAACHAVVQKYGLSTVANYGGHGIGKELMTKPFVPGYGKEGEGDVLEDGMVLYLEPAVCLMHTIPAPELVWCEYKYGPDQHTLWVKDARACASFGKTVTVVPKDHESDKGTSAQRQD
jgi:methionyl aminopeptidase